MEKFPLSKAQKIINFWQEITLTEEAREKRMREKADKAAQEFQDRLFGGKIEKEQLKINEESTKQANSKHRPNGNPRSLQNFLDLGLAPEMMQAPKTQTTTTTTKEESKEND